ncbi:RagB/SusD family nutrient uptake outer membrane protein [Flavihumibacter profundi]|uniref:RagB/SusD family nutrient uptake outer membrane protein n=1 Tax=Flavihumibacter profundi TaxID=2716883 RepID=UPI001CC45F37|nr:RagB/SusD family nutrient uptake outer membrane protein [Flavihumibacter profundi]MBZ5857805.1 RagB/SusD family nutrient uptake outer membrane protein [Flavihumibacter profundi]
MKRSKKIVWIMGITIPLIVFAVGCSKFLDRKPLTATLDDLHQGSLEGQVLGMYTILRTYAGFSTLPWIDFHSIRDDDAQKGSDANDGREVITEFETFQYTKDDWAPNTYWNDHYAMINNANAAIAEAKANNVSDEPSLRNVGEASFFLAYSYFELVKTYGEVPLFKEPILSPSDGIKDKSPIKDIYEFIDSNLAVAVKYLPLNASAYGTGYDGRLTSGAANTLWAQSYLFRPIDLSPDKWNKVKDLCTAVIESNQYKLADNFSNIWRDGVDGAGKNTRESIWEMQANVGEKGQSNSAVDNGSGWGTCQQVRQNGASNDWNLGWGWNTPTQNLVDAWPDDDPRKKQTILYSGESDGGTALGGFGATLPAYTNPDGTGGLAQKYWNKKLYTGNDPAMRSLTGFINNNGAAGWINHRILRYADVYLMRAEALNELGDGPGAAADLEVIRNRASGGLGPNRDIVKPIPYVSHDQMLTAIKNERRWEFALEGYRFYDLVRWGDADNVLSGLGYTHRCRYYPIPQKAIDLTGNVLKQNPEW